MRWTLPKVKKVLDDPKCTLGDAALIIGELVQEASMTHLEKELALHELREVAEALTTAVNTINEGQCEKCGDWDPLRNDKGGGYFA